jgi:hypothetical protein
VPEKPRLALHEGNLSYNPWYTNSYEAILSTAPWPRWTEQVPTKIALVFSWMPSVIMHNREYRKLDEVQRRLESVAGDYDALPD